MRVYVHACRERGNSEVCMFVDIRCKRVVTGRLCVRLSHEVWVGEVTSIVPRGQGNIA